MGKKYIVGDTGAGYAGKMLSMAAKKFGLKCKIFMGAKDIQRQQSKILSQQDDLFKSINSQTRNMKYML